MESYQPVLTEISIFNETSFVKKFPSSHLHTDKLTSEPRQTNRNQIEFIILIPIWNQTEFRYVRDAWSLLWPLTCYEYFAIVHLSIQVCNLYSCEFENNCIVYMQMVKTKYIYLFLIHCNNRSSRFIFSKVLKDFNRIN